MDFTGHCTCKENYLNRFDLKAKQKLQCSGACSDMQGFTKKSFDISVRICIQQIILVYFVKLHFSALKGSPMFRRQCNMLWGLFAIEI